MPGDANGWQGEVPSRAGCQPTDEVEVLKRRTLAGIAAAALVGGIIFCLVGLRDRSSAAGAVETGPQQAQGAGKTEHRKGAGSANLPPLDAPLHATLATLTDLADQGNGEAACRLALEYKRCNSVDQQLVYMDEQSLDSAAQGIYLSPESNPFVGLDSCEGVPPPAPGRVAELLRQSALSGNPTAMRGYVMGAAFSTDAMLDDADELRTYKNLAPQIAKLAIEGGDGSVLVGLAAAYHPETHQFAVPLLAQAVSTANTESLALFRVVRNEMTQQGRTEGSMWRFVHRQLATLEARASAEQRIEADRRAAALRATLDQPLRLPSETEVALLSRATPGTIPISDCSR